MLPTAALAPRGHTSPPHPPHPHPPPSSSILNLTLTLTLTFTFTLTLALTAQPHPSPSPQVSGVPRVMHALFVRLLHGSGADGTPFLQAEGLFRIAAAPDELEDFRKC